jgi:type I restriction enzyme S subunit
VSAKIPIDYMRTGTQRINVWRRERLKNRVRLAYGDSLAAEDRNEGDVPVFGSNGLVGFHDRAITSGETIIVGRKGSFGKVTWSDRECFPIDTTYYVDRSQTTEHLRWVYYTLESLQLDTVNFDSAVPGLSREMAYSLLVDFPPTRDQEHIAAYLDKSCAAIDAAIAAKQKQIETLDTLRRHVIQKAITRGLNENPPLNPTGNVWMTEVPSGWELVSLKRVNRSGFAGGSNS